jgi:hypothetical protein
VPKLLEQEETEKLSGEMEMKANFSPEIPAEQNLSMKMLHKMKGMAMGYLTFFDSFSLAASHDSIFHS